MAQDAWTGFLPKEYQDEIDTARKKETLAKILMSNRVPTEGKMVSGWYVPSNPFQHLANMATQYAGYKNITDADAARSGAIQRAMTDANMELAGAYKKTMPVATAQTGTGTQGLDGDAGDQPQVMQRKPGALMDAERQLLMSRFQQNVAHGTKLREERQKQFDTAAKTATSASVMNAAGDPDKLVPNYYDQGQNIQTPDGTVREYRDQRGDLKVTSMAKPTSVSQNIGPKGNVEMLTRRDEELGKERPSIQGAASSMPGLAQAFQLLESGKINSGALANEITAVRSLAALVGREVPPDVPATQFLGQVLLPGILNTLLSVAPKGSTSDKELTLAMQYAPTANRDPRALKAMVLHTIRGQRALVDDYNSRVDNLTGSAGRVPELDQKLFADRRVNYGFGTYNPQDVPDEKAFIERLLHTPVGTVLGEPPSRPGGTVGAPSDRRMNFRELRVQPQPPLQMP